MSIVGRENPSHKYTLAEVAEYCGRSTQLLRAYYSQGLLPDPADTVKHAHKKTRKFTLKEADMLKNYFASVKRNSLKPVKARARLRKAIEHGNKA